MRKITLYIAKKYFLFTLFSLVGFWTIFVTVNLIETGKRFIQNDTPTDIILDYYIHFTPQIISLSVPVACLLGALFTMGGLSKHNEITAMRACGISIARIIAPVMTIALLCSFGLFFFTEMVVPENNRKKDEIREVYIKGGRALNEIRERHLTIQVGNHKTLYISNFDFKKNIGFKAYVLQVKDNKALYRIDAQQVVFKDSIWVFSNGKIRYFSEEGTKFETFTKIDTIQISVNPDDLILSRYRPETLGYFELESFIDRLKSLGANFKKWQVEKFHKISFPFAVVIVTLVGVSLGTERHKSGAARSFIFSFFFLFIYYGVFKFTKIAGVTGDLSEIVSAWLANVIFFIFGLGFYQKAKR